MISAPESSLGQPVACQACGTAFHVACAEQLPEGGAAGDFDARLVITKGPQRVGDQILLGGVAEIVIGKQSDKTIVLNGSMVSRAHCKLVRADFGPSRWEIHDNNSTNGLFVNGERISSQELQNGDVVKIGDFELQYISTFAQDSAPQAEIAATASVAAPTLAPPRTAVKLGYGTMQPSEQRLLGDCPIEWVMKLRNAANLMVLALVVGFCGRFVPNVTGYQDEALDIVIALMNGVAAFLLTAPEPGAPESESWFSVRFFLRVAACITVGGELLAILGSLAKSEQLTMVGGVVSLMVVPETFLFLFYLRRLALRLPNWGLAVNTAIVMIGLPTLILMIAGGAFFAAATRSPSIALLTGAGGLIGLLVFRIWYLVLLIWFQKSFS
jgi:hypothetical protein